MSEEKTVTITQEEYDALLQDSEFLNCLQACGVDNWGGYDDAMDLMADAAEDE